MLHGTLDALVLKTLSRGPLHGCGVARAIEEAGGDALVVEEGSLYPALYRMERRRWLAAEWGESQLGRRAEFYKLTREGRAQLALETEAWRDFSAAVSRTLLSA
jgi:transcriptional regulator